MARRCTVFSLPPQVFECIATEMYLSDLFTLSTCSKRSFNLVKNTLLFITCPDYETPFSLIVRLYSDSFLVDLNFRQGSMVVWMFEGKRNRGRYWEEENPTRSVEMNSGQCNQKTIGFREWERGYYGAYGIASDSVQDLLQFIEHISTLFSAPAKELEIEAGKAVHLESILSVPILKNCLQVRITDDRSGTISDDAMRRVLKGFHCKKVNFHCNIDRNFNLPLEYNCESLSLTTSQFTYEHVNVFLHQWVQSTCKKPVDLEIDARIIKKEAEQWGTYDDKCWLEPEKQETPEEKWDLKKIAHGLSSYVITYLKNKNVLVFQRETDGMELRLQIIYANYQSEAIIYLFDNRKDHWTRRRVDIANQ